MGVACIIYYGMYMYLHSHSHFYKPNTFTQSYVIIHTISSVANVNCHFKKYGLG